MTKDSHNFEIEFYDIGLMGPVPFCGKRSLFRDLGDLRWNPKSAWGFALLLIAMSILVYLVVCAIVVVAQATRRRHRAPAVM